MQISSIICLIFGFIIINDLIINSQYITHYFNGNGRDMPTSKFTYKNILMICKNIICNAKNKNINKNFIFIDIGFGDGKLLKYIHDKNIFSECIGIEIEKSIYQKTCNNLNLNTYNCNLDGQNILNCCSYKNIKFYNIDAVKYNFENKPTIIYLYEPFYDIEYNNAILLYNKLLYNITLLHEKNIYIIYACGRQRKDLLDGKIFQKYGFIITNKQKIGTFLRRRYICAVQYKEKNI